jgi:hypothetical protein
MKQLQAGERGESCVAGRSAEVGFAQTWQRNPRVKEETWEVWNFPCLERSIGDVCFGARAVE